MPQEEIFTLANCNSTQGCVYNLYNTVPRSLPPSNLKYFKHPLMTYRVYIQNVYYFAVMLPINWRACRNKNQTCLCNIIKFINCANWIFQSTWGTTLTVVKTTPQIEKVMCCGFMSLGLQLKCKNFISCFRREKNVALQLV